MLVSRAKDDESLHARAFEHLEAHGLLVLRIEQGRPLNGVMGGTHVFLSDNQLMEDSSAVSH
jgi:hypothetical protein